MSLLNTTAGGKRVRKRVKPIHGAVDKIGSSAAIFTSCRASCAGYPGAMYRVMSRRNRRQALFLDDVDLLDRLKGDPAKLASAARLRRERTLSIKSIAQRIHPGTSRSANNRLHAATGQTASSHSAQPTLGP